jgi:malate:Na+ symporter
MASSPTESPPPGVPVANAWWKLMEARIGVVPWPVHLVLIGVIAYFTLSGTVPTEVNMMIAVLAVGGFTCAELGHRTPLLRHVGGAAICATFIPSALVYYHVLPAPLIASVTEFTKASNFLYLFITMVIVGSILSMDRTVLIKGFLKIFVPLGVGSIAAAIVGTLVGTLLGLGWRHTLMFIVVPVMGGGIGEGAIPLSVGYAGLLGQDQGDLFAQIVPAVMFGSLMAILLSGFLNFVGKRRPNLTGEGRLQPGEHDDMDPAQEQSGGSVDVTHMAGAALVAISLYLLGLICFRLIRLPAPVAMLMLAVVVKLTRGVSPRLQQGSFVVYQFFAKAVTYPLLFAIGVAMTPWDKLMHAFAWPNLVTIFATVATLMATGFFVGRRVNLYPIEAAIINGCHSGQGGTGDVAILTAANRMQLMPFAQVATRIGGAITVTLTLLILAASLR